MVYVGNKIGTVVKVTKGKAFIQDGSMSYCKPVSCCMKVKTR